MDIKGKLMIIFEEQEVTATFKKREFVLEYAENPQYPELLKFQMIQDKCTQLDNFNIGQEVDVSFNLRGRKWTNPENVDIYFNSLEAWKITAENDVSVPGTPDSSSQQTEVPPVQKDPEWIQKNEDTEADDLPF